jgi:hypothetical protein
MNLSDSLGSVLAGVFVSLVFYGISILQTYVARAFNSAILDHFLLTGSFTTSGQFKRGLRSLPIVLTEISYTEDTIILKSLVGYYLAAEDILLTILGGLGIRFRHASYISYMCRR